MKHHHKDSVSESSQRLSLDSLILEYEEEHKKEVHYLSAKEEENDNNSNNSEENIASDTTERPYRGNTLASQQLITESQEDIRDPYDDKWEDDNMKESITLQ